MLIYLPSALRRDGHVTAALAAAARSTVVRINYRLSRRHRFPGPVHDVLAGFDWVCRHLLPPRAARSHAARLGVCGELVGASLATMLALTECRAGEHGIWAAAVNNPIIDWVFPDELPQRQTPSVTRDFEHVSSDNHDVDQDDSLLESPDLGPRSDLLEWCNRQEASEVRYAPEAPAEKPRPRRKSSWRTYGDNSVLSTAALLAARDRFFHSPENYFDRFASPVCFFRSPSADLVYPEPDDLPAAGDDPASSPLSPAASAASIEDDARFADAYEAASNPLYPYPTGSAAPLTPTLTRARVSARLYPPTGIGARLEIPRFAVSGGRASPLHDQAVLLAKLVRRATLRQALTAPWCHDPDAEAACRAHAERAAELHLSAGLGLWSTDIAAAGTVAKENGATESDNQNLHTAATWLGECLRFPGDK